MIRDARRNTARLLASGTSALESHPSHKPAWMLIPQSGTSRDLACGIGGEHAIPTDFDPDIGH